MTDPDRPPAESPTRSPQPRATLTIRPSDDGRLEVRYIGKGPQNEEGADFPAGLLIGTLNELGAEWSRPHPPDGDEGGVDFVATGPGGRLQIQVTRVPADASRWQALRRESIVQDVLGPDQVTAAAVDLQEAIQRKGARLAPGVRAESILVLDATFSYCHAMAATLDLFDELYAAECQAVGFREVWVIGLLRLDRLLPDPWHPKTPDE